MRDMKYDPNNPLTDEQLDELAEKDFDLFLEYLDSQSEYLRQDVRPLNAYETKRMAGLTAALQGRQITDEEFERAKEIGKNNEKKILGK
jgi:hypothetical protein